MRFLLLYLLLISNVFADCSLIQVNELRKIGYNSIIIKKMCRSSDHVNLIISKRIQPITLYRGIDKDLTDYNPNYLNLRNKRVLYVSENLETPITFARFQGVIIKYQIPSAFYQKEGESYGVIRRENILDFDIWTVSIASINQKELESKYFIRHNQLIDLDTYQGRRLFLLDFNSNELSYLNFSNQSCASSLTVKDY